MTDRLSKAQREALRSSRAYDLNHRLLDDLDAADAEIEEWRDGCKERDDEYRALRAEKDKQLEQAAAREAEAFRVLRRVNAYGDGELSNQEVNVLWDEVEIILNQTSEAARELLEKARKWDEHEASGIERICNETAHRLIAERDTLKDELAALNEVTLERVAKYKRTADRCDTLKRQRHEWKEKAMMALDESESLRRLLMRTDSALSLLRHRAENSIPWGAVGMASKQDIDSRLAENEKALRAVEQDDA